MLFYVRITFLSFVKYIIVHLNVFKGLEKLSLYSRVMHNDSGTVSAPAGRTGNKRLQYIKHVDDSGPREQVPLIACRQVDSVGQISIRTPFLNFILVSRVVRLCLMGSGEEGRPAIWRIGIYLANTLILLRSK